MTYSYFLGANSENGFVSLYDGFPGGGSALHIIKGGPGGGKSSFMRRIGSAAEKRGMDVEYILCSGDPDSLDGVHIPALKEAWVDGTAPHVTEPAVFGARSDYVNLGRFCSTPLTADDCKRAEKLTHAYKALYAGAYDYLNAAGAMSKALDSSDSPAQLDEQLCGLMDKFIPPRNTRGEITRRFISAHSCKGRVVLNDTLSKLCKLIYRVHSPVGTLALIAESAVSRGADVILCQSPLRPDVPEAVLIPECSLAFTGVETGAEISGSIGAGEVITAERQAALEVYSRTLALGYDKLREAKKLHDALELIYRPYMNFAALDEYTEQLIHSLLP